MIGIYLCDDEDAIRHQIQTALEWKIFVENYDMKVLCSAAGAQQLLTAAENEKRGIYFLDVELKDADWDGFRLGQELRRRDPHGTLVYITSYGDLAWRTFRYHLEAFDYIVKEPEQIGPAASRGDPYAAPGGAAGPGGGVHPADGGHGAPRPRGGDPLF